MISKERSNQAYRAENMQIRRLLVLTNLGLSLTAAADFRTTMEVQEVEPVNLRLPTGANGTLSISDCTDADHTVPQPG